MKLTEVSPTPSHAPPYTQTYLLNFVEKQNDGTNYDDDDDDDDTG